MNRGKESPVATLARSKTRNKPRSKTRNKPQNKETSGTCETGAIL